MKIKNIRFVHCWEDCQGIENENIDVFVEVENGYTYNVTVGTAKNIEYLMAKKEKNYFGPGYPWIIVNELTQEVIEEAIKAYAEEYNGYWLQLYHFAVDIDQTVFDKLQAEHRKTSEKLERLKEFKKSDESDESDELDELV